MSQWEEDFPDDEMMSPRKEVGKGLSDLPIDGFVVDEKPQDEGDDPTIENPPLTVENEPAELPVESEQPAIPLESEQPAIPLESEQPVIPLESEHPVIPSENEQPVIPSESEQLLVPSVSEPSPDTDELVTETKEIALENPPTPVVAPSPPVTTAGPENESVPEKVVKKKIVTAILERKEPEESSGNRIPKSGDLVHENESRLEAELQQLLKDIRRVGEEGKPEVTFGELFDDDQVANYYEALVGTLKSAKKRNLIDFKGQMLLKGAHDKVLISIVGE